MRDDDCNSEAQACLVKRLLPELAENPRLGEQFAARGHRALRLHHPNIAAVLDVVLDGDECCVVAESYDGQTLREVLDRLHRCENALPVWFALHVAMKLTEALEYAHQASEGADPLAAIYHQDVSAENVLITETGEVKLVDFGLSRTALLGTDAAGTQRWSDSGEFDLWAPHYGDAQSDIAGLGRVLYELLTGRAPSRRFVPPSQHATWISPELDVLLRRMIGVSVAERYATARELRIALEEIVMRQRQPVDSSHLIGLLRLVLASSPPASPTRAMLTTPVVAPPRLTTILPTAGSEEDEWDVTIATGDALPISSRVPNLSPPAAHHNWDAAVNRVKSESQRPPPASVETLDPPPSATESFERGLEQLRQGDLMAAEAAWVQALALDPGHRLCQVNLKLLRKMRESERPRTLL